MSRLTDLYPYAFTDFFGSGTPCIYKTGPAWPIAVGQKIVRAARPIYNHAIAPVWRETAWAIVARLDSLQVDWNTVNPLAYANAGEAALICDFVITVGVKPGSLAHAAAVAAAQAVVEILDAAGFPEIQVAFIESVYRGHVSSPKLTSFHNPVHVLDSEALPALRKPFTPTLSPSIAPLKSPHYEGSGGLFYRLSTEKDDNRVALLTCAHVARPPPLFENKDYTRRDDSEAREEVILLGTGSYDAAVAAIMKFIGDQTIAISSWAAARGRLPAPKEDGEREPKGVTSKRKELTDLIDAARTKIEEANELHTDVTKHLTTTASRVLGFVLHCARIEVGEDEFMLDWSFIQMDQDKIDWDDFNGNKLFVGGNKTAVDWVNYMFPQVNDRREIHTPPEDMLLPLTDVVPEAEFRNPQNFDIHNVRTLLAVKNGRSTGTTFGRVNGLESITRHSPEHGIVAQKALEFIVCGYDTVTVKNHKFSDDGDSGSIVAGRDGRIIAQITGGGGPPDETDKTYVTPFYALQGAIKKKYPNCYLV